MILKKIDIYNEPSTILNKKSNLCIIIWNILLVLLMFILMLIITFYKFYEYETFLGYVKKLDDYKVVIYLKEFSELENYKLYLDEVEVDFSVYSISSDYYIINNENYYEIVLDVTLDDIYKIENNILNLKLRKGQTTYLEKIKKGIGL